MIRCSQVFLKRPSHSSELTLLRFEYPLFPCYSLSWLLAQASFFSTFFLTMWHILYIWVFCIESDHCGKSCTTGQRILVIHHHLYDFIHLPFSTWKYVSMPQVWGYLFGSTYSLFQKLPRDLTLLFLLFIVYRNWTSCIFYLLTLSKGYLWLIGLF